MAIGFFDFCPCSLFSGEQGRQGIGEFAGSKLAQQRMRLIFLIVIVSMIQSSGVSEVKVGVPDQFLIKVTEQQILVLGIQPIDLDSLGVSHVFCHQPSFSSHIGEFMFSVAMSGNPLKILFSLTAECV